MNSNNDAGVRLFTSTPVPANFANGNGPPLAWDWSAGVLYGLKSDNSVLRLPNVPLSGVAAPAVTPRYVGDLFIDTSARKLYFAVGTASSADWEIAN